MYHFALNFLILVLVLSSIVAVAVWTAAHQYKAGAETIVALGIQSGDAEQMNFTTNFRRGQSKEEKAKIASELFALVDQRRADNHAKYLEIKRKAIEENEAELAATGVPGKLTSITEKKGG